MNIPSARYIPNGAVKVSDKDLRSLVAATGRDRSELARMLGYASENSLRQAEAGRQALPADKLAWLIAYAKFWAPFLRAEARWLEKNPPPNQKKS